MQKTVAILLVAGLIAGCMGSSAKNADSSQPGKLKILATTQMIADAAGQIVGEDAEVDYLMGPGVDPHLYQPTPQDRIRIQAADVVFYHGLHLEGNLHEIFEKMQSSGHKTVAVASDIPEEQLLGWEGGLHDPHVWHDVTLWRRCVQTMADALIEQDKDHADAYRTRTDAYMKELDELHEECRTRVAEIPAGQRWLITSHDAFNYYGRAYGLSVAGIQGISTESEAGLKAITDAVDLIKKQQLKSIFPETSVPRAAIQRVADDSGASLGPELFSDALGGPGSGAETYVEMIKTNTDHIVGGLNGDPANE